MNPINFRNDIFFLNKSAIKKRVILSGALTSRSEVRAQSKDPYPLINSGGPA